MGGGVEQSLAVTVFNVWVDLAQLFLISVKKQRLSPAEAAAVVLACRGRFSCMKAHWQEHTAVRLCVCVCWVGVCGLRWLKFLLSVQNHLQTPTR